MLPKLITAQELADQFQVTKSAILKWAREGKIPHYKIVGAVRFVPKQIEEWERPLFAKYFTLHSYRHYFASKLIQDGADLTKVERLLGHESATTTNRYLHDLGVLD